MATVTITLRVIASSETPEAIYVQHPRNALKFLFLPKSQIKSNKPAPEGKGRRVLAVSEWLAEQENLI